MPAGPSPTSRRPIVPRRALLGLARRPDLWRTALSTGLVLSDPGWWHRWPPSPRPPESYEAFRHQTMFGAAPGAGLSGPQLVGYLEWCRAMRRLR